MTAKLLSIKESHQLLSIGRTAFHHLRKKDKTFPKPVMVLSSPKFLHSDIVDWIQSKKSEQEISV